MKQNITLSLEKELITKAKIIAAQKSSSVSKMLAEELRNIVERHERYEDAKRKALANLRRGYHLGGKILVSRQELHER